MCFYCRGSGLEHEQSSAEEITYFIKKKSANVGTDQNWKLLSDFLHFHRSDIVEPGFDYVQILGDNRPRLRSPARTWENWTELPESSPSPPTNSRTNSILKQGFMDGRKDKDNRVIKQDEIQ